MQDMAGGNNTRTPVKIQGTDNLVFVGIGKLASNNYARSHAFGLQNYFLTALSLGLSP